MSAATPRTRQWWEDHPEYGRIHFHARAGVRRINLRIQRDGSLRVGLPLRISKATVFDFLTAQSHWISHQRAQQQQRIHEAQLFYRDHPPMPSHRLKVQLRERLDHLAQRHGFSYERLSVRDQQTRWGSCSGRNTISINFRIQFLPNQLQDYLLLHELCHTKVRSHDHHFWDLLGRVLGTDPWPLRHGLRDYDFLFYGPQSETS